MSDSMNFPESIFDFLDSYSFYDKEEIYTNGSQLVQMYRVEQALEHYFNLTKGEKTS